MNPYDTDHKKKEIRSFVRIRELSNTPIKGKFNLTHLTKINAYIFQDSSDIAGKFRDEVIHGKHWQKERNYKGFGKILVSYSRMTTEDILTLKKLLNSIDMNKLKRLNKADFAKEITNLYQQLDYIHPFPDGNSRTLREFTRLLSEECGYKLDWSKAKQNELYLGRDYEVNNIAIAKSTDPTLVERLQDENKAILAHKQYKPLQSLISDLLTKL
ncbi:Fic family protein [Gallibacterium trehalosifermentans]|uniref:protein adenylyltransferase n=1 Tax=Gallibacterium trehalosifermentans TaxID=516935 RepID=A0ABV6GZJ0_9PAST